MKQHVSRASVILATSALTIGLTATAAAATGAYAGPVDGPRVGPGSHGTEFGVAVDTDAAKQRKIDRLRKALAAARDGRRAARAVVVSHAHTLSDRQIHANEAAAALLVATDVEHKTKADLAVARTRLNEVRALIEDGSTLLADNRVQQNAATASIAVAQAERDMAAQQVVDAETEIAWLTGDTIPLATANLDAANADVETLRQQSADMLALYTERTWAYHECRPQPDGWVDCLDFTYNWAIRSEVSDPWQRHLAFQAQQQQAQDVADDMAATLAEAQANLTSWTAEHATRTSALDAAEAAVTEHQDTLDALVVAAVDLTDRLASAKADEKKAATVETEAAAALDRATAVVKDAEYGRDTARADVERAERALHQAKGALADAQDEARYIKDRLKKARATKH